MDRQLRELLDAAVGEPPHRVGVEAVRRRVIRRRAREYTAGAAAIAVIAAIIPAATGTLGRSPGPSAGGPVVVPTVYVSSSGPGEGKVTPVMIATNTPGKPIKVGRSPGQIAITPDGTTAYGANLASDTVTPITIATSTAGKSIKVGRAPDFIAITPDGRTAYVANLDSSTVTPITTATNTAEKPIEVGNGPVEIAITPDGKTAYAVNQNSGTVTPITIATSTPGTPISVGSVGAGIAITPDGN